MPTCEKCWRDAHVGDFDVAANYSRLIEERKGDPCSPEEQAGENAQRCSVCGRITLHQHTGECMNGVCVTVNLASGLPVR